MASRISPSTASALADAVLLADLPVAGASWAASLPPCPEGARVSVLFSAPDLRQTHHEALERQGYVVAGVLPRPEGACAQLAVPRRAAVEQATWWRAIAEQAEAVWDTAYGPVRVLCGAALEAHGVDRAG